MRAVTAKFGTLRVPPSPGLVNRQGMRLYTPPIKGRFYLPIRRRKPVPPYLSYEAVSLLQQIHFRPHIARFPVSSSESEDQRRFVRQLGALGERNIMRGTCNVTLGWGYAEIDTPGQVIPGLQTLTNFQTLIIDSISKSILIFLSKVWDFFPIFKQRLEPTLGPGYMGKHEGHACLIFYSRKHR